MMFLVTKSSYRLALIVRLGLGKRINGGDASGRTLIEKQMWIQPI